jgi:hypothetical protein
MAQNKSTKLQAAVESVLPEALIEDLARELPRCVDRACEIPRLHQRACEHDACAC